MLQHCPFLAGTEEAALVAGTAVLRAVPDQAQREASVLLQVYIAALPSLRSAALRAAPAWAVAWADRLHRLAEGGPSPGASPVRGAQQQPPQQAQQPAQQQGSQVAGDAPGMRPSAAPELQPCGSSSREAAAKLGGGSTLLSPVPALSSASEAAEPPACENGWQQQLQQQQEEEGVDVAQPPAASGQGRLGCG